MMPTLFTRLFGLALLALTISVSSCQAVFPRDATSNAPAQLSPSSFDHGR